MTKNYILVCTEGSFNPNTVAQKILTIPGSNEIENLGKVSTFNSVYVADIIVALKSHQSVNNNLEAIILQIKMIPGVESVCYLSTVDIPKKEVIFN